MFVRIFSLIFSIFSSIFAWGFTINTIIFSSLLYFLLLAAFFPHKYCMGNNELRKLFIDSFHDKSLFTLIVNGTILSVVSIFIICQGSIVWAGCVGGLMVGVIYNQGW